ncbi:unnamed protein product [Peronospora destructor]|uniref:phospholipase D n=1 Tax=Peronospora destructor TaxID=86335 RepID=A0AAV0U0T3_9STRA|nr:unnamed protein product [Peronospora destructor]
MVTYSTENSVTTFTVTKEVFDSVYDDLIATKENDRVLLVAWNTDLIPLKPNDVNVRNKINKLPKSVMNDKNALFIFDDRLPHDLSSQHQKTLVLAKGTSVDTDDQPVAYVGGIDITNDRWDTIYHNATAIRDEAGIYFRNKGWVDSSLRIHDPAAKDVASNFLARWNSPYLSSQDFIDDLVQFEDPSYSPLPSFDYSSPPSGNQNVQIVRTYSCKYKKWEFAPNGEKLLPHSRIKAIKNAKNFIYIEDQYFIVVPELLDALMKVMPGLQRLLVVVQPPEFMNKCGGFENYMYENIQPIKEKVPNKLKMYSMKPDLDIYLHSKLVVIDDVYLSDGSASWNRRSMTSDPELDANVVDS